MEHLKEHYGIDLNAMKSNLYNLMMASLELSEILDQPIDKNGLVTVRYNWVAEKLFRVQYNAREVALDYEFILDYIKDKEKDFIKVPEIKKQHP